MEIDRSSLGESIIPWIHRKKLGRFRAYWRTCRMSVLQPKKFGQEMARPANLKDALLFRRVVVIQTLLVVAIPLTLGVLYALAQEGPNALWSKYDLGGSIFQLLCIPVAWACIALWLMLGTGFPSYFFIRRICRSCSRIARSH